MSRERLESIIPYVSMNPVPGHRHPPPMLWSPPPETSATTSSLDLVCAYICVIPIHISQILPIIYIYIYINCLYVSYSHLIHDLLRVAYLHATYVLRIHYPACTYEYLQPKHYCIITCSICLQTSMPPKDPHNSNIVYVPVCIEYIAS